MQAPSAVQCRSARLSEAVSPAKSARVAIGLIVVKSVAKSSSLDQKRRHMSERVFYPDTDDVSSTSKVVALRIARNRTRELILSLQQFNSLRTIRLRRQRIDHGGGGSRGVRTDGTFRNISNRKPKFDNT